MIVAGSVLKTITKCAAANDRESGLPRFFVDALTERRSALAADLARLLAKLAAHEALAPAA
jgi:hypothetical protein